MTIQEMHDDGCLIGETVICCGYRRVVVAVLRNSGGVVRLDQTVQGRDCWNVSDLRLTED